MSADEGKILPEDYRKMCSTQVQKGAWPKVLASASSGLIIIDLISTIRGIKH